MPIRSDFKTPEEYLETMPEITRAALEELRERIRKIVPKAEEVISYQIPMFKLNGKMVIAYAGFKKHLSLFPGKLPIDEAKKELAGYKTSAGTIQFPIDHSFPVTLLKKIIKSRLDAIKEEEELKAAKKAPAKSVKKAAKKVPAKKAGVKKAKR